jgi:hypothetical protein
MSLSDLKIITIKKTEPLTKLGKVFTTVDLILVPNSSAPMVKNNTQYLLKIPKVKKSKISLNYDLYEYREGYL